MRAVTVLLASLLVVAPALGLRGRQVFRPTHPEYTLDKWTEILANQEPQEEVCINCKRGVKPQSSMAGVTSASRGTLGGSLGIINGKKAKQGQFPYQVGVTMDGQYFCGGSIISEAWVLTAGHCVDGVYRFTVVSGSLSPSGDRNSVTRASTTAILHEKYDSDLIINDIGLISLSSPLSFNTLIAPVKLPTASDNSVSLVGQTATVSGWGKTSDRGGMSYSLMYVDQSIVDNKVGVAVFGNSVRSTNIVCDGRKYRSTCNGDSGGPLVIQDNSGKLKQVGIVSFGAAAGCAKGYPSVFTRVSSYRKWIESKTGIQL